MEWIAAMQQAITYIEAHLLDEINYEDAAKQMYISGYEFHRAFSFLTGMTANAYIRSRRLSLAGREIAETDAKITDIALKYGYDTPESFTKAFTRFHGVAPSRAREGAAKLVLFNPLAIKLTVEGGKSMDYRIVKTDSQRFLTISKRFRNEIINDNENHEISDYWADCCERNLIDPLCRLRPEGKRDLFGLCTPSDAHSDTFEYGIGIRIDADTAAFDPAQMEKEGYRIWKVKPFTYVVFECIGNDSLCIQETWEKFYREFLPQMGYEAADEADYEFYPEQKKEGVFCEVWIPVIKK